MTLEEVLHPLTPEALVEAIHAGRPKRIPGPAAKFERLFSTDVFWRCVSSGRADGQPYPQAVMSTHQLPVQLDRSSIERAVKSGNTVAIRHIDRSSASLRDLCLYCEDTIGLSGHASVYCYLSPAGTGYSFLHMDSSTSITLQISGAKTWRHAGHSAVPWSMSVGALRDGSVEWFGKNGWKPPAEIGVPADGELETTTLEAGDLMIMPPGVWHCVEASAGASSLSLNLRLESVPAATAVLDGLRDRCLKDETWRRPFPFSTGAPRATGPGLDEVKATLRGLRALIDEALADDRLCEHILMSQSRGSQLANVPAGVQLTDLPPRVRVPRGIRPRVFELSDGTTSVVMAASILNISVLDASAFVSDVFRERRFCLSDIGEWRSAKPLTGATRDAIVRKFVDVGLLVVDDPEPGLPPSPSLEQDDAHAAEKAALGELERKRREA